MKTKPTVYVVDNDSAVLKSLRWLIESTQFSVETFSSGEAFLETYNAECPGCLVLDMRMPGMSGLAVHRQLNGSRVRLPVIIMTGHADVPACAASFRQGAFDFIEKPIDDALLIDRIRQAIAADADRRRREACQTEIVRRVANLTPREAEVMELLVRGKSQKQIAIDLGISIQTTAKHRDKVLSKLEVANDVELVRLVLATDANSE